MYRAIISRKMNSTNIVLGPTETRDEASRLARACIAVSVTTKDDVDEIERVEIERLDDPGIEIYSKLGAMSEAMARVGSNHGHNAHSAYCDCLQEKELTALYRLFARLIAELKALVGGLESTCGDEGTSEARKTAAREALATIMNPA